MKRPMPDMRFAECVFDLTMVAADIIKSFPDSREIDTRDLFGEIYDLAAEFEYGPDRCARYYDEGNYLTDIVAFGEEKLREYFGLDSLNK